MTFHPKERGALSRRALLRRAGVLAAVPLAGGLLEACANSTSVSSNTVPSTLPAGSGGATGSTVPVGPGGIPLARRESPVTLPLYPEVPAIASGLTPEAGPLKVYNWSQYIDPDTVKKFEKQFKTKVQITTFDSMDQAIAKLTSGDNSFDVFFPTIDRIASIVAQKLLRPLNHDYLPNLAANIWPELQNPFYDVGAQYTVPYTVYTTGIAWRNDKVKEDIASMEWKSLWEVGGNYRGKTTILDDPRDALYLGMLYNGQTDINTEDPAIIDAALASLKQLDSTASVKVSILGYQAMPEGRHLLGQNWSGNILSGALYFMPAGVKPDVLSYWAPPSDGPAANDCMAVMAGGKNPVLAHAFLNFMLDNQHAYDNFANFNGYQPPLKSIDASTLLTKLGMPDSLAGSIVTPQQFATAKTACPLTPAGEALWDTAWKTFNAG